MSSSAPDGVFLGLYKDNGKENGNPYIITGYMMMQSSIPLSVYVLLRTVMAPPLNLTWSSFFLHLQLHAKNRQSMRFIKSGLSVIARPVYVAKRSFEAALQEALILRDPTSLNPKP